MHSWIAIFADNWRLFRVYFFSEERSYARSMFLILLVIESITVGLDVLMTYWNNDFIDTLQNFDQPAFRRSFLPFGFLAGAFITVSVLKQYLTQTFQLRWRRWLTNDFLSRYLSHHAYYRMSLLSNDGQTTNNSNDNPDQRISMDINNYIENVLILTIGLLNAIISMISYVIVLWSLSGVVEISITKNWSLQIQGIMVWAALVYAGFGTFFTNLIGRALFHLKYEQEHCEANYRYGLVRLRDHAESVAFYRSESNEQTSLLSLYFDLMSNFRQIIRRTVALNFFDSFYQMIALIFPYIVASSRYFDKKITMGDLVQIAMAFQHVHTSFSFIPNSYAIIVLWRSATRRLIEFDYTLKELYTDKQNSKIKFIHAPKERYIRIQNLTVRLPRKIGEDDGQILIQHLNLVLKSHQAVLITGNSGSGKSTFLRTLAGMWHYGSGMITFPLDSTVAFLPQRTYCPLGSLRHCLTYPSTSSSSEDDKKLGRLLNICQMNCWSDRLDEVQDWSRVLSLGEQQKMAFIRILYLRPKWLFLDEITSSLNEHAETYLYSILVQELGIDSTIISIGHRSNLRQFHQVELKLDNGFVIVMSLLTDDKVEKTYF